MLVRPFKSNTKALRKIISKNKKMFVNFLFNIYMKKTYYFDELLVGKSSQKSIEMDKVVINY